MSRAESVLIGIERRLHERSITVAQLRLLEKNLERFLELCTVWDMNQRDTKRFCDKAHSSFRARLAEVEKYEQEKRLVDKFVSACVSVCTLLGSGLPPGLQVLSQKLKEDHLSKDVGSLCHLDSKEAPVEPYIPIPPSCRQYLQPIGTAFDSLSFRNIWDEKAREVGQQSRCEQLPNMKPLMLSERVVGQQSRCEQLPNMKPLMLSEITDLICAPVISQWKSLCFEFEDGTISLERVFGLFGSLTNDSGALERELSCIAFSSRSSDNSMWKQHRQRQIQQYFKLRERFQAARALKAVISALEFSHSFKELDTICQEVCSYT